ncbi:MAG: GNAT family N-acetyltransferase [Dehalococcoidia bacterium]|nr:GNAT family N-acetyltransferase [Dehalococcoidia bacterium]
MNAIQTRLAAPGDAAAMSDLLAQRHRRDRSRIPSLTAHLSEPAAWRSMVDGLLANPRADVQVAMRAGAVVGFLAGERMLLGPADFASQFIPPQSIQSGLESQAVADGEDALNILRALYAVLARTWVDAGFFTHRISITHGDAELQEAWVTLGFGRYMTAATRPTANPVPLAKPRAIRIERASPEDIEDVMALADNLNAWHWQAPMFWPILEAPAAAAHQFNVAALRNADVPYFVAYEDGRPVGMQTFLRPGFTPPIVDHSSDVYLFEGVVSDDVRGGGVGAGLLAHSMEWARRAGHETCTLHFASGNPSGAPFWLGHGFAPVEHTMERTIDSRVMWARPKGS